MSHPWSVIYHPWIKPSRRTIRRGHGRRMFQNAHAPKTMNAVMAFAIEDIAPRFGHQEYLLASDVNRPNIARRYISVWRDDAGRANRIPNASTILTIRILSAARTHQFPDLKGAEVWRARVDLILHPCLQLPRSSFSSSLQRSGSSRFEFGLGACLCSLYSRGAWAWLGSAGGGVIRLL